MPVFATDNLFANNSISDETNVQEKMTSKIVREATDLREEYSKHFICEDGSYVVATYSEPVHYKDGKQWKEIDNTLQLTADEKSSSGKTMYTPKSGIIDVKIPQNFENGQKVSTTNKGYTISFGVNHDKMICQNKPTAVVKDAKNLSSSKLTDKVVAAEKFSTEISNESEITAFNNAAMKVENQTGAVVYDDVFGNDDLEYIVTTNSIKENIVVNEKKNKYIYSFDMDFGELVPVVNEDNSVRLVDPENTEETLFYIESPYMYDANGIKSEDIDMSLAKKDGIYVMTLQANEEWLNAAERAFPVIIDPTVYLSFEDVFVMDGITYKNTTRINDELRVGRNLANLTRTYIKPTLPSNIPAGSHIDSAYLKLTKDSYYQLPLENNISVRAYDCYDVASWNSTSITWNNQPYSKSNNGYSSGHTCLSSVPASSGKSTYSFDITNAVKRWINSGVNNGIMLASSDESSKTQIDFHSSRASSSGNYPQMYVTYTAPKLNISSWNADSQINEKSFTITTENDWVAYTDVDWISLNETSGTPSGGYSTNKIVVTENTSVNDRTGTVTVKSGNTTIGTIAVTQYGAAPYIILGTTALNFEPGNNRQSLSIESNTAWSFGDLPNWITVTPSSGSKNSMVEVEVSENYGTSARGYDITVTADTVTQTIHISQTYDNVAPEAPCIYEEGGLVYISLNSAEFDESTDSPEHIEYKLGNGEWIDYEDEPLSIVCTSDSTLYARIFDTAGNVSEISSLVLESEIGEYTASFNDIAYGNGVFPVLFERTYSSLNGWFFSFEANVQPFSNGYVFTDFNGEKHHFIQNREQKYVSADGDELELNVDGYAYKVAYGGLTSYFDNSGKLAFVEESYISATYTWTTNNLYIEDQAGNSTVVKIKNGKPISITISRHDDITDENHTKYVSYQWSGNNLIEFTDAANIQHSYAYTDGLLNQNDTETIDYSVQGRVKRITQQNGAFVKFTYNDSFAKSENDTQIGKVTVSDSKGVTDTWYYKDGISITNNLAGYSDEATYDPSNIDNTLTEDTVTDVAYVVLYDIEQSDSTQEDSSDFETSAVNQNPLYDKNVDGSYTFYKYDSNNRVIETLEVAKGKLTVTANTTYARAETVAKSKTTTAYVGDTDDVSEWITFKRNSNNKFVQSEKEMYTYYEAGGTKSLKSYTWGENDWEIALEENYDEIGNISSKFEYKYSDEIKITKTQYTYDEEYKILEQLVTVKTGENDYVNSSIESYTYNSQHDIITNSVSQWLNNAWYQIYGEQYAYNGYGNNTQKVETVYTNVLNLETGLVETAQTQTITDYIYDVWNQPIKTTVQKGNKTEIINEAEYDILGRTLSVTDDNKTAAYTYDNSGNVLTVNDSNGTTTYEYFNGNLISRTNPNNTVANYTYDCFGNVTAHSYNGYVFTYNTLGSILTASAPNSQLVSYTYSADTKQNVLESNFGNGQTVNYEYNDDGSYSKIMADGQLTFNTTKGWLEKIDGSVVAINLYNDYVNNIRKIIDEGGVYGYNLDTGNSIYSILNDDVDQKDGFDVSMPGNRYNRRTDENKDVFRRGFIGDIDFIKTFEYDENNYNRLSKIQTGNIQTTLKYNDENLVSLLTNKLTDVTKSHGYTYDNDGRIKAETMTTTSKDANGTNFEATDVTYYTYDSKGQLIVAENSSSKVAYSYDSRGNIIEKNEYTVSIDENNEKVYTENANNTYEYDQTWKDELTAYNGQTITYDASGNPIDYMGHNLSWSMGRQLASFDNITYTYDENGIRASKTSNGVKTKYFVDLDGNVVYQTDETNALLFYYDRNNEVIGFRYNNDNYFYVKNQQGDITDIVDSEGEVVASYQYDAWGKIINISGSNLEIANLNPFRYRGYYYDADTSLYYLQSRYYDPEMGRFINCDDVKYIGATESEVSYNPFAYCENEPVNRKDASGYSPATQVLYTIIKDSYSGKYGFMGLGFHNPNANKFIDFFDKTWSTKKWCLQKTLGYCDTYDNMAWAMGCFIHCLKSEFFYKDKWWRIELWMGRYGISVGGEIGVYNSKSTLKPSFYNCAGKSDELKMSFNLFEYAYLPILLFNSQSMEKLFSISTNMYEENKHWWLTGFLYNINLIKHLPYSRSLRMDATIVLKTPEMARYFKNCLETTGLTKTAFRVKLNKNVATIYWTSRYNTI